MKETARSGWIWLGTVVLLHLVVSIVHGEAHSKAHVALSPAGSVFVLVVIIAGPLIGLGLAWPAPRIGAWVIALTMAGALIFGLVNHFVLASPDHISQVDPQWRPLFTTTAIVLVVTEALGAGLAVRLHRIGKSR
jgi:hypothetical protein